MTTSVTKQCFPNLVLYTQLSCCSKRIEVRYPALDTVCRIGQAHLQTNKCKYACYKRKCKEANKFISHT